MPWSLLMAGLGVMLEGRTSTSLGILVVKVPGVLVVRTLGISLGFGASER